MGAVVAVATLILIGFALHRVLQYKEHITKDEQNEENNTD